MPVGTWLYAPEDGLIDDAGFDQNGYGLYLRLITPDERQWLFAHLSDTAGNTKGASLKRGAPFALSGNSGNSTGPHLHIGYRPYVADRGWPYDGYVEPFPFLLRDWNAWGG